jgi:hypothetical protein
VSSEIGVTKAYLFHRQEWQKLVEEHGLAIMTDDAFLLRNALEMRPLPFETSLPAGEYVFVTWGLDLIVPETIIVP